MMEGRLNTLFKRLKSKNSGAMALLIATSGSTIQASGFHDWTMVLDFLYKLYLSLSQTLVFVTKIVGKTSFLGTINRGVGLDDMAGYPRQNIECDGENSSHICRPKISTKVMSGQN